MGKIAEGIAARATALVMEDQVSAEPADEAPADTGDTQAPADSGTQLTDTEAAPTEAEPVQQEPDEAAQKRALLAEKLAATRAKRAAFLAEKQERQLRSKNYTQQIEAELEAARAERAKYEGLRQGSFKDTIVALGRDPVEAFKEMQQEAVEADTPEAKLRLLERRFEERFEKTIKPLEAKIQELEQERLRTSELQVQARFQADFVRTVASPEFNVLREAYDDEDILAYADDFRRNPNRMYAAAQQYGVRLTAPRQGATMLEILSILKAAQVAHDEGRKARRERLQAAGLPAKPRVNGTTAPSKAETETENDSASTRTNGAGHRLSRKERIEAEIERLSVRR